MSSSAQYASDNHPPSACRFTKTCPSKLLHSSIAGDCSMKHLGVTVLRLSCKLIERICMAMFLPCY